LLNASIFQVMWYKLSCFHDVMILRNNVRIFNLSEGPGHENWNSWLRVATKSQWPSGLSSGYGSPALLFSTNKSKVPLRRSDLPMDTSKAVLLHQEVSCLKSKVWKFFSPRINRNIFLRSLIEWTHDYLFLVLSLSSGNSHVG
jgi:hypothetical protein